RLPVQAAARAWVETARRVVSAGAVLVVDYVASAGELAELPQRSWLRTYRGHEVGADPLLDPGTRDITVPVVLDQLPVPDRAEAQAAFLRRHGIDELVEEGRRVWRERASTGDLAALRARSRVREAEALLDEGSLGSFTVLQWVVH